ncbi:MAG: S8 family serine peptidase, partial [Chthoniobacterales bacterium]
RENLPITYLNEFAQEFYRNWLQHGEFINNEENGNDSLKTNTKDFEVTSSETSLLTLVAAPTSNATSSSNSYWSDAIAAAGIIAFTAFGHELMVEEGRPATDSRPLAEQPSLTLNDFRAAAEAHPRAERFVIHENGTIQPREADPTASGRIRSENIAITQTLKAALHREYSSALIEELLPHSTTIIANPPHLSTEKLREIFAEVDAAKAKIQAEHEHPPVPLFVGESNAPMKLQKTDINIPDFIEQIDNQAVRLIDNIKLVEKYAESSKKNTNRHARFHAAIFHYQQASHDLKRAQAEVRSDVTSAKLYFNAFEQSKRAAQCLNDSADKLIGLKGTSGYGQKSEVTFYEAANYAVRSASCFRKAADYYLNAIKDVTIAKEINDLWYHAYQYAQGAACKYARAADYRQAKDPKKASIIKLAAEEYEKKAFLLAEDAINLIKRIFEAKPHEHVIATLPLEEHPHEIFLEDIAALQLEIGSEEFHQSEATSIDTKAENDPIEKSNDLDHDQQHQLEQADECDKKAEEFTHHGDADIARILEKIASLHRVLARHYQEAATAYRTNSQDMILRWKKALYYVHDSARWVDEAFSDTMRAVDAKIQGKTVLATIFKDTASHDQVIAECWKDIVDTMVSTKEGDINFDQLLKKALDQTKVVNELKNGQELERQRINSFDKILLSDTVQNLSKTITLKKIKNIVKNNPSAKRLIIEGAEGSWHIEPSYLRSPMRFLISSISTKNSEMGAILRLALQKEYGSFIAYQVFSEENHRDDWGATRINQIIQKADEIRYPTVDQATEEELQQFPGARVIQRFTETADHSTAGIEKRVRILKTDFKYPLVRIEEEVNESGSLINRKVMVADHLLLTLKCKKEKYEESINLFYNYLKNQLTTNLMENVWIEECTPPFGRVYRLHIKPNFLEEFSQILVASQQAKDKIEMIVGPDFITPYNCSGNDPLYKHQWNLHGNNSIHLPDPSNTIAKSITTNLSEPVRVGIFDTGIHYNHEDLIKNMCQPDPNKSYMLDQIDGSDPMDEDGHGTHCAGIIGAIRNNPFGIVGIAPNIQLIPFKIFKKAQSNLADEMVDASMTLAQQYNVKILNYSIGPNLDKNGNYPEETETFLNAVTHARDNNMIFVMSAGNEGKDNDTFKPYKSFQLDNVLVVAATGRDGRLANFSNYGANSVHIAAPGESIWSTCIQHPDKPNHIKASRLLKRSLFSFFNNNNAYCSLSGTSMAAPHVTGALACIIDQFPELTYKDADEIDPVTGIPTSKLLYKKVINRLLKTADKIDYIDGRQVRYGRLNLGRALTRDREYAAHNDHKLQIVGPLESKAKKHIASEPLWKDVEQRAAKARIYFTNAKEAFISGRECEGDSWDNAFDSAYFAAEKLGQAIEEINQEWKIRLQVAARAFDFASDTFRRAAKTYGSGKIKEGSQLDDDASNALRTAEELSRLIQTTDLSLWNEAIAKNQEALQTYNPLKKNQ